MYLRKKFKKLVEEWSDSLVMQTFLAANFLVTFVVLLPLMIVAAPFYLSWSLAGAILESVTRRQIFESYGSKIDSSKWGSFMVDLTGWKDMEKE
jgi:hypothetical protein